MLNWKEYIKYSLKECIKKNQLRKCIVNHSLNSRYVKIYNKYYYDFSSNDYLGLSSNFKILNSLSKYSFLYNSTCSSNYILGYKEIHRKLKNDLINWLGYDKVFLFTSGYSANQSIINTFVKKNDRIIVDKLFHASLIEASYLNPAKLYRFNHNSIIDLERYFNLPCNGNTFFATEGIFSMNGDFSCLNKINKFLIDRNSLFMVDDAHGIGILGNKGEGVCSKFNVKPDLLMITFSKAFGLNGAALFCNKFYASYFKQFSKYSIYSTSFSPLQAYFIKISLKYIINNNNLRNKLNNNINYFSKNLKNLRYNYNQSFTPIHSIIFDNNEYAKNFSLKLKKMGFWINSILPPSVPNNSSRIRIIINATHKKKDINFLLNCLNDLQKGDNKFI